MIFMLYRIMCVCILYMYMHRYLHAYTMTLQGINYGPEVWSRRLISLTVGIWG